MKMIFKQCEICGNIIAVVNDSSMPVICCGQEMKEIIPNTTDGAFEKHVPKVAADCKKVTVTIGETDHPMTTAHYIEWVALETTNGNQRKELKPNDTPTVCFALCENEKPICAYAYCNLHGLWKKDIK